VRSCLSPSLTLFPPLSVRFWGRWPLQTRRVLLVGSLWCSTRILAVLPAVQCGLCGDSMVAALQHPVPLFNRAWSTALFFVSACHMLTSCVSTPGVLSQAAASFFAAGRMACFVLRMSQSFLECVRLMAGRASLSACTSWQVARCGAAKGRASLERSQSPLAEAASPSCAASAWKSPSTTMRSRCTLGAAPARRSAASLTDRPCWRLTRLVVCCRSTRLQRGAQET
jgi:hypothetical protein